MFGGYGQDYFYDSLAFGLSLIPFGLIAALLVASLLEEPLKVRAEARHRNRKVGLRGL
jgi:heme exporter protein D